LKLLYKVGLSITLGVYLLILTKLVLLKFYSFSEILSRLIAFDELNFSFVVANFIPFYTMFEIFFNENINISLWAKYAVGNVVGFMPFGFLLPLLFKQMASGTKIALSTFCLSLTYELGQTILNLGSFDVDDLILNTLGGILGYMVVRFIQRILTNKRKRTHQKNRLSM
jgi:glycopeptide antibiotics resistance protein